MTVARNSRCAFVRIYTAVINNAAPVAATVRAHEPLLCAEDRMYRKAHLAWNTWSGKRISGIFKNRAQGNDKFAMLNDFHREIIIEVWKACKTRPSDSKANKDWGEGAVIGGLITMFDLQRRSLSESLSLYSCAVYSLAANNREDEPRAHARSVIVGNCRYAYASLACARQRHNK